MKNSQKVYKLLLNKYSKKYTKDRKFKEDFIEGESEDIDSQKNE